MTEIIFIASNQDVHRVNADIGISLMEVARTGNVPGIEAECGGACSCATCHVYLGDDMLTIAGTADGMESDMLEFIDERKSNSRLACQVIISAAMDGMAVYIPDEQGF